MPYKNIHWIKLEKRLLHDYRFYTLPEEAQLIYLKMLMLAAETTNKIPKNSEIIKTIFRTNLSNDKIKENIKLIQQNFPKFVETNNFYRFREWSNRCNWINKKELRGSAEGTPEDGVDKIRKEKIRKEYIRVKEFDISTFQSDDYSRMNKAINTLYAKAKKDAEVVCAGLEWLSKQGYEWTLETLIKKWPDFMKFHNTPDILKQFPKAGRRLP